VGKPVGKLPFGRPRRRWEDNIKMNSCEMMWWWNVNGAGSESCQMVLLS